MSGNYRKEKVIILTKAMGKRSFKIKEVLRGFSCTVNFTDNVGEIVEFIESGAKGFLIVDESFRKYFPFVCYLIEDFKVMNRISTIFIVDKEHFLLQHELGGAVYIINDKQNIYDDLYKILYEEKKKSKKSKAKLVKSEDAILEERAISLLVDLGFSQSYIGFNYIKDAMCVMVKDGFKTGSIQKAIYPAVAIKNGTHVCNVQRNIRSAIEYFTSCAANEKDKIPLKIGEFTNRSLLIYLSSKIMEDSEENPENIGNGSGS